MSECDPIRRFGKITEACPRIFIMNWYWKFYIWKCILKISEFKSQGFKIFHAVGKANEGVGLVGEGFVLLDEYVFRACIDKCFAHSLEIEDPISAPCKSEISVFIMLSVLEMSAGNST